MDLSKYPKTQIDDFDLKINPNMRGDALRRRLGEIMANYETICAYNDHALYLLKKAEYDIGEVEALAWGSVDRTLKVNDQRKEVRRIIVDYQGSRVTILDMERKLVSVEYIANRGKSKLNEAAKVLDLGRTLLSFDKQELGRQMGGEG